MEIGLLNVRVENFDEPINEFLAWQSLDMIEEKREDTHLPNITSQQRVARFYSSKVRKRTFRVGDLVLK